MTRGRYPAVPVESRRPAILRLLDGPKSAAGADSGASAGPGAAGDAPAAPKHLPPMARRYWDEVAPVLAGSGRLPAEALGPFEVLCRAFARIREAEALLDAEGLTYVVVEDGKGGVDVEVAALLSAASAGGGEDAASAAPKRRRKRRKASDETHVSPGLIKRHPAAAIVAQYFPIYNSVAAQFGLTPATKQRLDTGQLDLPGLDSAEGVFGGARAKGA